MRARRRTWRAACDVVTLEIEQISPASMEAAASFAPVRPGGRCWRLFRTGSSRRTGCGAMDFRWASIARCGRWMSCASAVAALGGRCFCKSATGGYDGRGQGKVGFTPGADVEDEVRGAWEALGERAGVAEQAIELEREISVLVARSPNGEVKVYPPAWNHHENQILAWSVIPAPIPTAMEAEARKIAEAIADTFQLEGLLAVEMFCSKDGKLLVNELAPRPHNSYHASERACVTSQFEQLVRAVCDLPLGDVEVVQPAAIVNLLGDVWLDETGALKEPKFDAALAVPGVRLHLYEKHRPRKGRKMGHLSAVGATAEEAVERCWSEGCCNS